MLQACASRDEAFRIIPERRTGRPLALMMLDLDTFKRYNDAFGHPAGDETLRFVGDTLLLSVRGEDLACRYGGEEFSVILTQRRELTRSVDVLA